MDFQLMNTTTLKLELFNEQRIPKYAILSHTWADEEILYDEMIRINGESSPPAIQKSGYLKIGGTCDKTRSHGFEYAWIDTCCIDRSSSTYRVDPGYQFHVPLVPACRCLFCLPF